jgi:hypothetical protein
MVRPICWIDGWSLVLMIDGWSLVLMIDGWSLAIDHLAPLLASSDWTQPSQETVE